MHICQKCGSTRISGPRYIKANANYGTEALEYSCNRCGYSEQEPCRDAEKKEVARPC